MRRRNRLTNKMLLAYYGELSPEEQARLTRQLDEDPMAAEEYRRLSDLLDTLHQEAKLPSIPDDDEYWAALEHAIFHRLRQEMRQERLSPWRRLLGTVSPVRAALAFGGIIVAFFLGATLSQWYTGTRQRTDGTTTSMALPFSWESSAASTATGSAVNEQVRNFLKQSQLYIATTADKQLACTRCIPIERQVDHREFARELLSQAQRLRAVAHHNPKVRKVLQDVELVLATLSQDQTSLSPEQMEVLHHIASTTVCEVSATVDTNGNTDQP